MKLSIQREELLTPLQQVIGVVERRQTLPVLGNILLDADEKGITFTATDLEVELQTRIAAKVETSGRITIPARKILDICRTLPETATIEITVSKERARIQSGKSRFQLSTLPASDFPAVEKISQAKEFSVSQATLKTLIDRTIFAMAQQDVRYYLNGLMLETGKSVLRAVATDGHRLALCEFESETGESEEQQIIIPRKGVQELHRLLVESDDPVNIEIGSNHIRVTTPVIRFTSKLIDGRFPDYQRVIPKDGDKRVLADREKMRQALLRTSILSNEKYRGIRLGISNKLLKIQAHNPEQEEAEEEFEIDYNGESLEIGFNVTYLLDALSALSGDHVEVVLHDANSSCLIEEPGSNQCRYVVMPMRL